MPLTLTASWPSLVDGWRAKASEVESKFDWIEGTQLPMVGGAFTTGVYDLGSSTYKWRAGYFGSLVIGGQTLTANASYGVGVSAWGAFGVTGSTISASDTLGINTITRTGTGQFSVTWTTPFATSGYALVCQGWRLGSATALCVVNSQTAGGAVIYTYTNSSTALDINFSIMGVGDKT